MQTSLKLLHWENPPTLSTIAVNRSERDSPTWLLFRVSVAVLLDFQQFTLDELFDVNLSLSTVVFTNVVYVAGQSKRYHKRGEIWCTNQRIYVLYGEFLLQHSTFTGCRFTQEQRFIPFFCWWLHFGFSCKISLKFHFTRFRGKAFHS